MKRWMIFRSEATGHHYIYNGENVIDFTPAHKLYVWDWALNKVEDAFSNARKKLFITDKVRYMVVARGQFIDN